MLVIMAVGFFSFFIMGWVGARLFCPQPPTPPGSLEWAKAPVDPGAYFIWTGRGMEIKEIVVKQQGQQTMIGGKHDGGELVDVDKYGARLWAGPILPPILPMSEADFVRKIKGLS